MRSENAPNGNASNPEKTATAIALFHRAIYGMTAGAAALFFGMVLASVVSRFVLKTPMLAAVEISRISFIWACFLGAAIAFEQHAHITITFIADRFPEPFQRWNRALVNLFVSAVSVLVMVNAIRVCGLLFHSKLPVIGVSQSVFYLPLVIASFSMALTASTSLLRCMRKDGVPAIG